MWPFLLLLPSVGLHRANWCGLGPIVPRPATQIRA